MFTGSPRQSISFLGSERLSAEGDSPRRYNIVVNPDGKEQYILLSSLGTGSYGEVFLAFERHRSCIYAIKQINFSKAGPPRSALSEHSAPTGQEREASAVTNPEVRALKRLNLHPHQSIPTFYHALTVEDSLYIVMERITGPTLTDLLGRYRAINDSVLPIIPYYYTKLLARGLFNAVHHCHRHGVAHLDIKPDNINVPGPSRLFLMDYGQSYNIYDGVSDDPWLDSRIGAMAFLPPEVLTSSTLYTNSYLNLKSLVSSVACDSGLTPTDSELLQKTPSLTNNNSNNNNGKDPKDHGPESTESRTSIRNQGAEPHGTSQRSRKSDKMGRSSISSSKGTDTSRGKQSSVSTSYTSMHHISTLFLRECAYYRDSNGVSATPGHKFQLWLNSLRRMGRFIKIDRPKSPPLQVSFEKGSVKLNSIEFKDLIEVSGTFSEGAPKCSTDCFTPNIDPMENVFPLATDLFEIGVKLGILDLKGTTVHIFNSKLAIDSWSVGVVLLICIIGDYPFRDMSPFEIVPSVNLMADAIRYQLDETVSTLLNEENIDKYTMYLQEVNDKGSCDGCGHCSVCVLEKEFSRTQFRRHISSFCCKPIEPPPSIKVSPNGPLPPTLPLDLFILIAGLLHPNPKARLSISEARECPWLSNTYEFSLQEHEMYTSPSAINMFCAEATPLNVFVAQKNGSDSARCTVRKFVRSVRDFTKSTSALTTSEDLLTMAGPGPAQASLRGNLSNEFLHRNNNTISKAVRFEDRITVAGDSRRQSTTSCIPEPEINAAPFSVSGQSVMSTESTSADDAYLSEKPFDFEAYQQGKLYCDQEARAVIFDESHESTTSSSL